MIMAYACTSSGVSVVSRLETDAVTSRPRITRKNLRHNNISHSESIQYLQFLGCQHRSLQIEDEVALIPFLRRSLSRRFRCFQMSGETVDGTIFSGSGPALDRDHGAVSMPMPCQRPSKWGGGALKACEMAIVDMTDSIATTLAQTLDFDMAGPFLRICGHIMHFARSECDSSREALRSS